MCNEITKQCTRAKQAGERDWEVAQEGRRLIKADICARTVLFAWFLETFHDQPDICNPENFLLLQLHSGQALLLQLFARLSYESKRVIEDLEFQACIRARKTNRGHVIFAIDDAHVAASKFSQTSHSCQFPDDRSHSCWIVPGNLYKEYKSSVFSCSLLSCGSCITAATGVPPSIRCGFVPVSGIGAPTVALLPLPALSTHDVEVRLRNTINVTPQELADTPNLHHLVGRPRWCAAVVEQLAAEIPTGAYDGMPNKAAMLSKCIADTLDPVINELTTKLLAEEQFTGEKLTRLLQRIFVVDTVFERDGHGIELLMTPDEAELMLRLGLCQVMEAPLPEVREEASQIRNVTVAVNDYVTRAAVERVAEQRRWDLANLLGPSFTRDQPTNINPLALPLRTIVAGAIASHNTRNITVAEFLQHAVRLAGQAHLPAFPEWTRQATLGAGDYWDFSNASFNRRNLFWRFPTGLFTPNQFDDIRSDLIGTRKAGFVQYFLTASTNVYSAEPSGTNILDDLTSTIPTEMTNRPPSDRSWGWNDRWASLAKNHLSEFRAPAGERTLRIQVVLGHGYKRVLDQHTIDKLREYGEVDDDGHLNAVHVKGEEVRVIVDHSNVNALFLNEHVQAAIAASLAAASQATNK